MGIPARPRFQKQGPACNCVVENKCLGWLSCTAYATAMAIDKATLGSKRPTGCYIRDKTNDTVGGTTLPQCTAVAEREFHLNVEVHTGSNVASAATVAAKLRAGRGAVVQGSTRPLLSTSFRSTGGTVNHAIYVNEGRGWNSNGLPDEVLVYDPAADGRYSFIDQGPSWWPWSLLVKFAGYLQPWGEQDRRILGMGRFYVAFFPDTEPHAHLKYGGVRTVPFPDQTKAYTADPKRKVNVRRRPDRINAADIVDTMAVGETFVAYQVTKSGVSLAGSRVWYGNHDGNRWVHESGLKGEGGTN